MGWVLPSTLSEFTPYLYARVGSQIAAVFMLNAQKFLEFD